MNLFIIGIKPLILSVIEEVASVVPLIKSKPIMDYSTHKSVTGSVCQSQYSILCMYAYYMNENKS